MRSFFLIAGEPSGDRLGAALMRGLKQECGAVRFAGVGGPLMQAEGLDSLFPMELLSVMGLAEVLPRLPDLLRRVRQTADAAIAAAPDALITIDSPDFCLRVAGRVRDAAPGIPTVHYVAPSVWAWRPKRASKMAKVIDHVLAILPFEPPYMEAAGMSCDFVGHPAVTDPVPTEADARGLRKAGGIAPDAPLLAVLPGSRKGEVERLLPVFAQSVRQVATAVPGLRIVLPTTAHLAAYVRGAVANWPGAPVVLDPGDGQADPEARKRAAFAAADAALAASGTVSLELAATATPMVIGYDMNWLSRQIVARALQVDTVTLVNLVTETRAVPEFLGADCQPGPMADAVVRLFGDSPERDAQIEAAALTMQMLGRGGADPGLRAARSVLRAIG